MASGTIPVQSGNVIDITPISGSSSFYDITLKYVSGIVYMTARVSLTAAGGPYSHYFIPAQYAPSIAVALDTVWGSDANAAVNAYASVSSADADGNRCIRVVNGTPALNPSVLLVSGSWPVA